MPCHSPCWVFTSLVATPLPWNPSIKILKGQVWRQGGSKAVSPPKCHLTSSGSLSLNKTWCTLALCPRDVLSWETHMDALLKVPQAVHMCLTSRAGLAEVHERLPVLLHLLCLKELFTKSWIAFDFKGGCYIIYFEMPDSFVKICSLSQTVFYFMYFNFERMIPKWKQIIFKYIYLLCFRMCYSS